MVEELTIPLRRSWVDQTALALSTGWVALDQFEPLIDPLSDRYFRGRDMVANVARVEQGTQLFLRLCFTAGGNRLGVFPAIDRISKAETIGAALFNAANSIFPLMSLHRFSPFMAKSRLAS